MVITKKNIVKYTNDWAFCNSIKQKIASLPTETGKIFGSFIFTVAS
jgi:hypothetical protein